MILDTSSETKEKSPFRPHDEMGPVAAGLGRDAAARYVGVSAALFDRLVRDGVMPKPIALRRRRIWFIESLTDRLRQLADRAEPAGPVVADDPWLKRIQGLRDGGAT